MRIVFYLVMGCLLTTAISIAHSETAGTNVAAESIVTAAPQSSFDQKQKVLPPQAVTVPYLKPLSKPERSDPSRLPQNWQDRPISRREAFEHPFPPGMNPVGRPDPRQALKQPGSNPHFPNGPQSEPNDAVPRNLPLSMVKKYDVNKDGKLDGVEWAKARQDMENRNAEMQRLRNTTNNVTPDSAAPIKRRVIQF